MISIVLAVYNGEKYLPHLLESLKSQIRQADELVISDDGSTDRTLEIISGYSDQLPISLVPNKNRHGVVGNFENALCHCTGDFVALCDQDDVWKPNKLNVLVEKMGTADLIHSDATVIDEDGREIHDSFSAQIHKWTNPPFRKMLFRNPVTGCTALFKKKLMRTILPFPSGLPIHDWWIAIAAKKNGGITYIGDRLMAYRQHRGNLYGAKSLRGGFWSQVFQILAADKEWMLTKNQPEIRLPFLKCLLENRQRLNLSDLEVNLCERAFKKVDAIYGAACKGKLSFCHTLETLKEIIL